MDAVGKLDATRKTVDVVLHRNVDTKKAAKHIAEAAHLTPAQVTVLITSLFQVKQPLDKAQRKALAKAGADIIESVPGRQRGEGAPGSGGVN
jgi:hypothetical protein